MTSILKKGASKEEIQKVLVRVNKRRKTKKLDISKYAGSLRLGEDALIIQKKLRDEWE